MLNPDNKQKFEVVWIKSEQKYFGSTIEKYKYIIIEI